MKKIKYQIYQFVIDDSFLSYDEILKVQSGIAVNKTLDIELPRKYKYATGILLSRPADKQTLHYDTGVGDSPQLFGDNLMISDNFKTIINRIPTQCLTQDLGPVPKKELFFPINIPAEGNILRVNINTFGNIIYRFVVRLENEKNDAPDLNFQWKRINIPRSITNTWESPTINLSSFYKKVVGFNISPVYVLDGISVAVKDAGNDFLIDHLPIEIFSQAYGLIGSMQFLKAYLPVDFNASQPIKIESTKLYEMAGSADYNTIDVLFLLEN